MKKITDIQVTKQPRPIKAVQFGEGNFLRAFVDYMLDIANEKAKELQLPCTFEAINIYDLDDRYRDQFDLARPLVEP